MNIKLKPRSIFKANTSGLLQFLPPFFAWLSIEVIGESSMRYTRQFLPVTLVN